MTKEAALEQTASMFLALGDPTRLRLLNLMRDREVCVTYFIEALSLSQPKISRHLAYLRHAGLVDARRDGKWIHYRISTELDESSKLFLQELFRLTGDLPLLKGDRDRYLLEFAEAEHQQIADVLSPTLAPAPKQRRTQKKVRFQPSEPVEENVVQEPVYEPEWPSHNELEEFLL